ncbi:hypothetical protein [Pseudoalteromonas sp. S16_S37]|uniref:hypothetical protein n=1 Tax=Pseudoalteromonas sp. S16_S37 TaxID=2720228 RepID=UPI001680E185|nr:hypothetical protein [Pseudoalteromonas sp. S16_S37]MBD1584846.1 hypothetical protein [Pseudoalteromonas sp. S16_S37]
MLTLMYFIFIVLWVFFMMHRIVTIKETSINADSIENWQAAEQPNSNVYELEALNERNELLLSGEQLLQSTLITDLAFEGLSEDSLLKVTVKYNTARSKNISNLVKLGVLDPQIEKSKLKRSASH